MKRRIIIVVCIRLGEHMPERIRNFQACMQALNDQTVPRDRYEIWVCEEGPKPYAESAIDPVWDEYIFRYSKAPFNRSRALNEGARASKARARDFLCLMDADLLVDGKWVKRMYDWAVVYPSAVLPYHNVMYLDDASTKFAITARHNGYLDIGPLTAIRNSMQSVGGAMWAHAALYWHIGGHDEEYIGWGCEDADFYFKLEGVCRPSRLRGVPLLHLNHPKAEQGDAYKQNRERFEEKNQERLNTKGGVYRRTDLVDGPADKPRVARANKEKQKEPDNVCEFSGLP